MSSKKRFFSIVGCLTCLVIFLCLWFGKHKTLNNFEVLEKDTFHISINSNGLPPSDGTGFLISYRGQKYILTCAHVIGDSTNISISDDQGQKFRTKVLKVDKIHDIALLDTYPSDVKRITGIKLSSTDSVIGSSIYTAGFPMKMGFSAEEGFVSGLNKNFKTNGLSYSGLIEINTPVNSGDSGSPVLDQSGKLIGMIVAKISNAEEMGYAIPLQEISDFLKNNAL